MPVLNPVGAVILQLTGTKANDWLVWCRFEGFDDGVAGGHQPCWRVAKYDTERYALTVQPECLFTLDGLDLFSGLRASPKILQLIDAYKADQKRRYGIEL